MNTKFPRFIREGPVMMKIRIYLGLRARSSRFPADTQAYATLRQISNDLKLRYDVVDDSLGIMLRNGEIKLFPNGSKWRRLFGSKELPQISENDVVMTLLAGKP